MPRAGLSGSHSPEELGGGEWLWVEDRMTELLRLDDASRPLDEVVADLIAIAGAGTPTT